MSPKPRRTPRIVSRKARAIKKERDLAWILDFEKPSPTEIDNLLSVIEEESTRGYICADDEYGLPYVRKEDFEDMGNGLYVIRFRCPSGAYGRYGVEKMTDAVCSDLHVEKHVFMHDRMEYGLPFLECVWAIQMPRENPHVSKQADETESDAEVFFAAAAEFV